MNEKTKEQWIEEAESWIANEGPVDEDSIKRDVLEALEDSFLEETTEEEKIEYADRLYEEIRSIIEEKAQNKEN